jgi:homocysteine S-methyltransferase
MTPRDSIAFSNIRVLDGGLATELERRGCDISGPLWSAHVLDQSPATIAAVHLDYLRAGADCISTASYQVSALGYSELAPHSPADPARQANAALRHSVELADQTRTLYAIENPRRIWIAASLGPYGAALHNGAEYHGRYAIGFEDLAAFHAERLAVLADTNADTHADIVALETIPSLEEALAILRALEQTPALTAWISFTCRDAAHVAHGEPLRACAEALAESPQIAAIGINCTAPHLIAALIREARAGSHNQKPIIVYPNSGETWDAATRTWDSDSGPASVPDSGSASRAEPGRESATAQFGALARQWYAAGAQAVGGCCRTGPAHVAAVAEAARTANPAASS